MLDKRVGRWLVTDPAKQHWSPYMAMGNNPAIRSDINGKWDFLNHSIIIHAYGVSHNLTDFQIEAMTAGSEWADRRQEQKDAFIHSMLMPDQSLKEGKKFRDDFIIENLKISDNQKSEFFKFFFKGAASHPLQDENCPTHNWKVQDFDSDWSFEDKSKLIMHGLKGDNFMTDEQLTQAVDNMERLDDYETKITEDEK